MKNMTLEEFLISEGWPDERGVITRFAAKARVSRQTVYSHLNGMKIGTTATADRMSRATGRKVSVPELCGWT